MSIFRRRDRPSAPQPEPWVVVTHARLQPEAELVVNILSDRGIPAYHRRTMAFDVPDFFGFGPRVVLVPADRLAEAREVLAPGDEADQTTISP